MKGIARFAEYSISGGLLWINIIVFITLINFPADTTQGFLYTTIDLWNEWLTEFSSHLKQANSFELFSNTINSLAASLFILLIFCTGLMLDLISPFFCTQIEILFFRKSIKSKEYQWLKRLTEKHVDFLQDDYQTFVDEPLFDYRSPKVWPAQKRRYNQINSFLLAYLFANSDNLYLTQLTDKLRLWYTSRAITTSLLVLCVLLNLLSITSSSVTNDHTSTFLYTLIIPLILISISFFITVGAYTRFSNSMLALAYHIQRKEKD